MPKEVSYSSVLKNPGFLNLWINQVLVQLAYNSLNFALLIWVFKLTNSNTAVSLLVFSVYLPAVLFGLFAGIIVDISDRKKIITTIDILLALIFFSLILLKGSFLAILFIAFLVNSLAQFYMPSESSAIPLIVRREQLFIANSLFSLTLFTMFLLGFGLSGPIINLFGIDMIFWGGGAILLLAYLLSFKLPSICCKPDQKARRLIKAWKLKNLLEIKNLGLRLLKETIAKIRGKVPLLAAIVILSGIQGAIAIMGAILPSFMEKTLKINATDGSYILIAPLGVGMIMGALLIGKIGHFIPRRRLTGASILTSGLLLFSVGASPFFFPAIQYITRPGPTPFIYQPSLATILAIGSFLLGIALVATIVPSQTVLQENTTEKERGRVFSVLGAIMSSIALLPVLLVGVLSDYLGTTPIFVGIGGSIAILGLLALKPDFFFEKKHLSFKIRVFFGLGHWNKVKK